MSIKKLFYSIVTLALTFWLLAGCGSLSPVPTTTPAAVPTPVPSATLMATAALKPGTITGRVHLVSPPTPRMVVYAVDNSTGLWAFTETDATDAEASYTLVVPPGSYQVFAFSDMDGYAGYSLDGWTLAFVNVAENQTVSDIIVRPPSQSECGSMFGVPASPDGRFKAAAGPADDCKATQDAFGVDTPEPGIGSSGTYVTVPLDICQILQEDASRSISATFTLVESEPFTDPLTGETGFGCSLTAKGTGNDFGEPSQELAALVNGFLGWEEQIRYQADGPTGTATGMTRDMGLLLITVGWEPSSDAVCPSDQPISACELKPEQKLYTILIQAAMK